MAGEIRFLDKLVFGADATRCPLSGIIWETGIGAPSREVQTTRALEAQPTFKAEIDVVHQAEAEGFKR